MESTLARVSRRGVLKAGAAGIAASQLSFLQQFATAPNRLALAAGPPSNIQFDIGAFIPPAFTVNNVLVRFGPVFTLFVPARLNRTPSRADQTTFANALATIEANYPWSPSGLFTFVSYGLPYFRRLPSAIVAANMPRLLINTNRFALEEAVPSPTDVSPQNPGIVKRLFNVPVRIEQNDVLFMFKGDSSTILSDVLSWLQGSNRLNGRTVTSPSFGGLFSFQTPRAMFQQMGMNRLVASHFSPTWLDQVNSQTPMWMSFSDQQVDSSGPAQICTVEGNASARLTNATASSYFANGAIQHFSHVILDLAMFFDRTGAVAGEPEDYAERVQYMFRSNEPGSPNGLPAQPQGDGFANGGGPSFVNNTFQGTGDASRNARGIGTFEGAHRMGHESALQRSSRALDGTPVHIRMDGSGLDAMDVPGGNPNTPKLQFTIFVPTAEFFRVMRINQASLDLVVPNNVEEADNGLERHITTTRRQNFLIPPRVHRAFPLRELFA